MDDDAAKNIWKGQFEGALAALASFSKRLMILNLSVFLTYVTQYFQWTKQKDQLGDFFGDILKKGPKKPCRLVKKKVI
jgi:hypothetical protein